MFDKIRQRILYEMNIQTPGLRMLILYFGHVGVQMRLVRLNSWVSVLNFAWNLAIDVALFYAYMVLDPFQLESLEGECAIAKPMFGHLVHLVDKWVYPSIYVINLVFAYFYGSQLMHLLDSDCLYRFYVQGNKWRTIYIGFISSHFLFFFLFYSDKINALNKWPTWEEMLRYGTMYACLYQYWACAIVHYVQFATINLLKGIEHRVAQQSGTSTPLEQYRIIEEIRTLALINHDLNQLISLPMVVFILLNTFNIIMFVCMALLCRPVIGLLLHALVTALYLGYLIVLNDKVLCTFQRIAVTFRSIQYTNFGHSGHVLHRNTYHRNTAWGVRQSSRTRAYLKESEESRRIRCSQVDIYYKHFTIRMFDLGKLDIPFLLNGAMFILGYIVLITQTN